MKVEQPDLFEDSISSEQYPRRSFPPSDELPKGFLCRPSVLTEPEQSELLGCIRHLQFREFDFHGFQAKRRVIEFGYHYDFEERDTTATDPIPEFLLPLRNKAGDFAGVSGEELVEAIITEYPPGAPIGWHRDVPQFEIVIGISLASSCRMRLKPMKGGKITSIVLEPGSVYVMRGPARWQYQHSIPPVKELRYSITFRTLRLLSSERDVTSRRLPQKLRPLLVTGDSLLFSSRIRRMTVETILSAGSRQPGNVLFVSLEGGTASDRAQIAEFVRSPTESLSALASQISPGSRVEPRSRIILPATL